MKQVKLADFGLAREQIEGAMTSEAGTYRWMAPEVNLFHFFSFIIQTIVQQESCIMCQDFSFF